MSMTSTSSRAKSRDPTAKRTGYATGFLGPEGSGLGMIKAQNEIFR
jgi:hypothetical protein